MTTRPSKRKRKRRSHMTGLCGVYTYGYPHDYSLCDKHPPLHTLDELPIDDIQQHQPIRTKCKRCAQGKCDDTGVAIILPEALAVTLCLCMFCEGERPVG